MQIAQVSKFSLLEASLTGVAEIVAFFKGESGPLVVWRGSFLSDLLPFVTAFRTLGHFLLTPAFAQIWQCPLVAQFHHGW